LNQELLLGIDIGTTGVKGLLVDDRGVTVATATADYPLSTPKPKWAEQHPDQWWQATVAVVQELLTQSGVSADRIKGIGLSGQMHSLVLLGKNLRVLRPAILWCDTRTDEECRWINETVGLDRLKTLVANRPLEGFTLPKILWVRKNEPDVYDRIHKIMLPKDFIRFKLTGEIATEVSDAAGTLMFDVRQRTWSDPMLQFMSVPKEWLPPVRESVDVSGTVGHEAATLTGLKAGTPVVGGGGDNACGAVGTGVVKEGRILATIGTSGVVFAHSDTMKIEPNMRTHSFCHSVPGCWCVTGVVLMAGGALRWYKDTFCQHEIDEAKSNGSDVYDVITRGAEGVARGSEGLFFQPYLTGERTPHQTADPRAAFIGATIRHTKQHFSRAVLEGITFAMRDSLELIRGLGSEIRQIRLTGGGAKSRFWRQLQANVYGAEVALVNSTEGAALGAALLAGAGTKMYGGVVEAAERTIRVVETIAPNPKAVELYNEFFKIYSGLYPSLKRSYQSINEVFTQSHPTTTEKFQ